MSGAEDPKVLEWAATHGRVLATHDLSTITNFAYARVSRGEAMPGVIQVPRNVPILRAIQDLELIAECAEPSDLERHVLFLPL
jgi:hypothetical protein